MDKNIMQKAAYLKGLAEGMELDTSKKENKLIAALIELVDELSEHVYSLESTTADIEDELDEIAEELLEIETEMSSCDCDDECDCNDYFYEVVCPSCDERIELDETLVAKGGIECPVCGEELEFDLDDIDCDCE